MLNPDRIARTLTSQDPARNSRPHKCITCVGVCVRTDALQEQEYVVSPSHLLGILVEFSAPYVQANAALMRGPIDVVNLLLDHVDGTIPSPTGTCMRF